MAGAGIRVTVIGLNYSPETTGTAPYTTRLAHRLRERGHTVTVLTGYPHYPEWKIRRGYRGWRMSGVQEGIRVDRLRHFVPAAPTYATRMLMEISFGVRLLFARWHRPDVVVFVNPALFATAFGVLRSKFGRRVPNAVWVQDLYSRGVAETASGGKSLARPLARAESRLLNAADKVVAIHESFRQYITGPLGVPEDRVAVIRNWTHLAPAPATDRDALRRKLGWQPDDIIVLHAGNMGVKQGLENVVEAARGASGRKSKVRFILLGDGNQREKLHALGAGIPNLGFLAPLPEVDFQPVLAAADILLVNELPGVRGMSVPSKLTSYFSTGRPVIAATDADSVTASEVAASGGGVLVPAGEPETLVTAAEQLGSDPERARRLGGAGLRFREQMLAEAQAIAAFEELLAELAREPAAPSSPGFGRHNQENSHVGS
ncbi:glycosyltransferase family 4 protein [Arthrobacter sp. GCM10027362]|uniref:glycosyltransferase family 4 protein n=1 Tax=Arthrobacter sp. GCM10027362 TaxID=3273379 RepID=UPI00362CCD7C